MNLDNLYTATKCGHRTKLTGLVSAFNETVQIKIGNDGCLVKYCLDCIGEMTIQCALCGRPLFIGHPITIYTIYNDEPLYFVGCIDLDCAVAGVADRVGFWLPGDNGKGVARVCQQPTR